MSAQSATPSRSKFEDRAEPCSSYTLRTLQSHAAEHAHELCEELPCDACGSRGARPTASWSGFAFGQSLYLPTASRTLMRLVRGRQGNVANGRCTCVPLWVHRSQGLLIVLIFGNVGLLLNCN